MVSESGNLTQQQKPDKAPCAPWTGRMASASHTTSKQNTVILSAAPPEQSLSSCHQRWPTASSVHFKIRSNMPFPFSAVQLSMVVLCKLSTKVLCEATFLVQCTECRVSCVSGATSIDLIGQENALDCRSPGCCAWESATCKAINLSNSLQHTSTQSSLQLNECSICMDADVAVRINICAHSV